MSAPAVSVIVPVFNGERFLAAALDSILRQPHRPLEIIVVDDGSTDGTAAVARRYSAALRYVHQENRGCAGALNRGLALAGGDLLAFLDADDLWTDDKLSIQLARLGADAELDIVAGRSQWMRAGPDGAPQIHATRHAMLSMGSALIRRRAFARIGGFDESFARYGFDADWFFRAKEAGLTLEILPATTLYYRRHADNLTNDKAHELGFYARALKKSLDRRRAGRDVAAPLSDWFPAGPAAEPRP